MKNRVLRIPDHLAGQGTSILGFLTSQSIALPAACAGKGTCGLCRIRLDPAGRTNAADRKRIPTGLLKKGYRLACQHRARRGLTLTIPAGFNKHRRTRSDLALGLDLGTTVIKAAAVDLTTGAVVRRQAVFNPQNNLGADVMTRITEAENGKNRRLVSLLKHGIDEVKRGLGLTEPVKTAVVGNPVMLSFYLGRSLSGLTRHPFTSAISERSIIKRHRDHVFPVIGGFVGGDTLAGLYALADRAHAPLTRLYIDLGTNGEVAVMDRRQIWAASTAAGPAFEGAGIACGSLAVPGAIDRVGFNDKFTFQTIDNCRPVGFCASGLIDLLASALRSRHLAENGRLLKPIRIAGFSIRQDDIRILQLAVAALHSGIQMLLAKTGLTPARLDEAVITGEFGQHMDLDNMIRIGLLPSGIRRVRIVHDLALQGAILSLSDNRASDRIAKLKVKSRHLDLARQPEFQDRYVSALCLKPWP